MTGLVNNPDRIAAELIRNAVIKERFEVVTFGAQRRYPIALATASTTNSSNAHDGASPSWLNVQVRCGLDKVARYVASGFMLAGKADAVGECCLDDEDDKQTPQQ